MIEINKQGNAIRIDFTDNDKYLFNGTMEVASNELMLVVDESDMITFKRTTNGDVLFSQKVDNIKIAGSAVTKDNVIQQFATIGYSQSGGGGAGAVTSVNGQTGNVVLTATSLGAITKADADTLYATKSDLNSKADISAVEALSTEVAANRTATTALTSKVNEDSEKIASLDTEMDNKANSADVPTNTQFNSLAGEVANKADKTSVYTKQEVDEKFATNVELNHVKAELATKADTSSLNDYALKSEITGLATKEELADYQPIGDYATTTQLNSKQDTLVSGQNIKTINGQSVIGEGNIEIQQPIASADTLGGVKVGTGLSINPESGVLSADSPEWDNISGKPEDIVNITERLASKLDTATYNSEKSSFATKDELNSKADASAIADMATQTWVQGQGYLTEVPSNYVTDSELTEGLAGKQDKGDYALKSDLNTLATKEELATKADASALSSKQDTLVSGTNIKTINGDSILGNGNLVIQSGASNWDDIQGKPQFAEVATSGDYNDLINKPTIPDISGLATKEEMAGKQDTLVSGTNIKTINGKSILGEGNIKITSGSKAWYFTGATSFLTTETTNAGINVVGGTISYDQVSVGDTVVLDSDYYFTVLNKFVDTSGNHISILPLYNAATGGGTSIISYIITLQSSSSAYAQIDKANIPVSKVWTATANKSLRVDTYGTEGISLSGWTGYNTAKPGDVVHITYSNYNWNLVVTGRCKDNNGTYLTLSGLGDKFTGYKIDSRNKMYSYVPFDQSADKSIIIGSDAHSYGGTKYEVAIGAGAVTQGTNAVAIGSYGATANANAIAIGAYASANEDGSTVIGADLKANKQDGSTIEKVLVGYYDAANSTSVPVLAYNETDGARIRSGNSLKSIATKEELDAKIGDINTILDSINGEVI